MGKKRNIIIEGDTPLKSKKAGAEVDRVSSKPPTLKTKSRGKRYLNARSKVDKSKYYKIEDALAVLKSLTFSQKNKTIDLVINLGIDIKKKEHKQKFKSPTVHKVLGKLNQDDKKILDEYKKILEGIKKDKPAKVKGSFIISIFIKTSMSPSIRIQNF